MVKERIDPLYDLGIMKLSRLGHIKRYNKVLPVLKRNFNVLDAGCGYGYGSKLLSKKSNVIGMDISKKAINYAKKNYSSKKIKYFAADLENISLKKFGKFEVITCFEVLEHSKNPSKILKKFRKNISKKGYLFLSVPNGSNAPKNNPHHLKNYKVKDIINFLDKTGFYVEKIYGQYPILGLLALITNKITKYETDTEKKTGALPSLIDSIPLFARIFSTILPGKLILKTSRTMYFVARPK